jgi:hypothetical protein
MLQDLDDFFCRDNCEYYNANDPTECLDNIEWLHRDRCMGLVTQSKVDADVEEVRIHLVDNV